MPAISAESHNATRRAAKARQQQAARARALHKRDTGERPSIIDMVKENDRNKRRIATAIQKGHENGQRLLAELKRHRLLSLKRPTYGELQDMGCDCSTEMEREINRWERNCKDLLAAAKADPMRFDWNREWLAEGRLNITVRVAKAA